MDWNEIEAKWAEMARRVRSDLPRTPVIPGREQDPQLPPRGDLAEPPYPERKMAGTH